MYNNYIGYITSHRPEAAANITGSPDYPQVRARAQFYSVSGGVLVYTEATGLPSDPSNLFQVFAYHIHAGDKCTGNAEDPFADALGHYNPTDKAHPYHAGDLPPLFSNYGFAWNIVFTSRFRINEVIGKAIVIHRNPDDFTSQPAGNSGSKIACGIIEKT
jgi:Cu-Zn family superoxide dismutase